MFYAHYAAVCFIVFVIQALACQFSSILMQLLFSFDQDMRVEKTLIQTLTCQLSSTLMQLLFSFDQDKRVEKTLIQTLACQLSLTFMLFYDPLLIHLLLKVIPFCIFSGTAELAPSKLRQCLIYRQSPMIIAETKS